MAQERNEVCDVAIVGGGPAGLSAALLLGRCGRRVVVYDRGKQRNLAAREMHGFLSRDGMAPSAFLQICRDQLAHYPVEIRRESVSSVQAIGGGFRLVEGSNVTLAARKVLLAFGMRDHIPNLPNIDRFLGNGVFSCPYCDGWEVRGKPLAMYCKSGFVADTILGLLTWSRDVTLCTDGGSDISRHVQSELRRSGIRVRTEPIERLDGAESLERIVFRSGDSLVCRALFLHAGQHPSSPIAAELGCEFTKEGRIKTDRHERTTVRGVYAAGDVAREPQLVVVAAAQGAKAALAINRELRKEEVGVIPEIA